MDESFLRVPYVARATLVAEGRSRSATICNLSLLGLYLQVEHVPEGEFVVQFHLPDGGGQIEASADVTWVNDTPPDSVLALPTGCGIRFTALSPADYQRIQRTVAHFRAEPVPQIGLVQPASGFTRIPLVAPCSLVGAFGFSRGATCNLSVLGVYCAVDRIPEVGETIQIEIDLPGFGGRFESPGTVTWQNLDLPDRPHGLPPGCGVRLRNLTSDDQARLGRLVADYLASLPAVGRDRADGSS